MHLRVRYTFYNAIIFSAFQEIAIFFLKYELQDKNFKSVAEFIEAVNEFMKDFIYWITNLGAWVDAFNARKAYYFGQLGWELGNGKRLCCKYIIQLNIKSKMRHPGPYGLQIQLTGDI